MKRTLIVLLEGTPSIRANVPTAWSREAYGVFHRYGVLEEFAMQDRTASPASRTLPWAFALVLSLIASTPWLSARAIDGTWSAMDPSAPAPGPRREYAAVYDDLNQRYVVFAGLAGTIVDYNYHLTNEVWSLTLGATPAWSQLSVLGAPPGPRASAQYGYDPVRHRVLIFGGYGSHYPGDPWAYLNDVWELSLEGQPRWAELTPSGTPPVGRLAGAAAYDVLRQRFVGFGGTRGLPVDTWELDLSGEPTWSTVQADGPAPPGSYGMASIYDPVRDRMIIFGGSTSDYYYGTHNDTWELQLHGVVPNWHKLDPMGPLPVARRTMASIYDPLRDRMIIYGGWDGNSDEFLGDAWALSLHGSLQWTQLETGGTLPMVRDATAAAYDPAADRMVVFGGWSGLEFLGDTQFLTWGGAGSSASASVVTQVAPGAAHLAWNLSNSTGTYVGVYRRQTGEPWSSLGAADADASGHVAFDDFTVTPGESYGYLVVVASERGAEVSGETQVDVPTPTGVGRGTQAAFGVEGIQPNPAVGRFTVSFALADESPARVEVFDVRGRRITSRDVGTPGAGPGSVEIDGRSWTSGVYFVRLFQSGHTAQRRVVVAGGAATP